MFYFDSLSFSSIRFLCLLSHLLLTFFLLWTKYDPILITLKSDYSTSDYKKIEDKFDGIIGFGIASLIFEVIMILIVPHQISFFNAIKLMLDIIGSFFVCWIVLDGLSWQTYIYVLVFCVVIPTFGDIFKYFMFLKKNIWVNFRNTQSIFEILNKIPEALFKIIFATIKCIISIHIHVISCIFPPVVERDEPTLYERFCGRLICFEFLGSLISDPIGFCGGCFTFCTNPSSWCEYLPSIPSEVNECCVATYEGLGTFVTMIGAACSWLYKSIRDCWRYSAPRIYDGFMVFIRQIRLFFR